LVGHENPLFCRSLYQLARSGLLTSWLQYSVMKNSFEIFFAASRNVFGHSRSSSVFGFACCCCCCCECRARREAAAAAASGKTSAQKQKADFNSASSTQLVEPGHVTAAAAVAGKDVGRRRKEESKGEEEAGEEIDLLRGWLAPLAKCCSF
jgi:hypothetical protein